MATTAAMARVWGRGSVALAAMAVPPATVLAALGLGVAGLASGDAAVAATGAFAGAVGAGVATWRASDLQARMRRDRERYLESRRTLQLLIEQLRRRAGAVPESAVPESAVPESAVPDTVPDEMPVRRPINAPAISMELPVLSTWDEPVAGGHLAAVVQLRAVPRHVEPSTLPIGELERRVYAAIAAQDAEQELSSPVAAATAPIGAGEAQG